MKDYRLSGFQARSRGGRWSWAAKVGLLSLQVVPQQRCNGHCLCDYSARQLKQQLRNAQVAAQRRGDTVLTLPLFWRRSTVSPVFFGRYPRSSLHSFGPPPPPPPQQPRFCGRKATWSVEGLSVFSLVLCVMACCWVTCTVYLQVSKLVFYAQSTSAVISGRQCPCRTLYVECCVKISMAVVCWAFSPGVLNIVWMFLYCWMVLRCSQLFLVFLFTGVVMYHFDNCYIFIGSFMLQFQKAVFVLCIEVWQLADLTTSFVIVFPLHFCLACSSSVQLTAFVYFCIPTPVFLFWNQIWKYVQIHLIAFNICSWLLSFQSPFSVFFLGFILNYFYFTASVFILNISRIHTKFLSLGLHRCVRNFSHSVPPHSLTHAHTKCYVFYFPPVPVRLMKREKQL